jgi:hypothetical protein
LRIAFLKHNLKIYKEIEQFENLVFIKGRKLFCRGTEFESLDADCEVLIDAAKTYLKTG